jgi:hypothetical protein
MATFFIFSLFIVLLVTSLLYGKLRYGSPPPGTTDGDLVALVRAGKARKAVRWYRLRHGVGLTAARRGLSRLVDAQTASTDAR